MAFPHRYLVRFGPQQTPHYFCDLLIVGSGIAGLRAALAAPSHLRVLVITKDRLQLSNSSWAQGGIAAVRSPEDRFEDHITDTLAAGAGLCDRDVVEMVVREAPQQINDLIAYGADFDEDTGMEGGHSYHRIVHALGDATGLEVMRAIIDRVQKTPNITVWDQTFTLDLLTHDGACVGALVHHPRHEYLALWAKQTVLASGGVGMVYRETTNPSVATGDGMAAAYRAGAELRDMEFMQFHPTVMYVAGSSRHLISEAVRGAGAHLVDKNGVRFMLEEDDRGELATRDIVARAIVRCMERTQHSSVYLTLAHLDREKVLREFPGIAKMCGDFDIDITQDRIPVRPGAHYMIGGISVDLEGRTTLPGLWAAGEVTSSGLHGANRLASNSLLEGLVYGSACGRNAGRVAAKMSKQYVVPPIEADFEPDNVERLDLDDSMRSLRTLMVRQMGIVREAKTLQEAEQRVAFWCRYVLKREFDSREGWELQNLLTVARLMIWSARERTESRGVHFRSDHPLRDDANWIHQVPCPASLPNPQTG